MLLTCNLSSYRVLFLKKSLSNQSFDNPYHSLCGRLFLFSFKNIGSATRAILILIIDNIWSHWQSNQNTIRESNCGETRWSHFQCITWKNNFDTYTESCEGSLIWLGYIHTPPILKSLDISLSLAKLSGTVHQFKKKLQRPSFLFYLCFLNGGGYHT